MWPFDKFKAREPEPPITEPVEDSCPHDDWMILGHNSVIPPAGTCMKCGKEVRLHLLLNNWKARVERELQIKAQ
jgi:hypothetical protein